MKKIGKFCVITDTAIQNKYSHLEIAKIAIQGGADMIQFRDKSMPTSEMTETAVNIRKLCNKNNVLFIVNDRVDVVMLSDADGVHLGKEDIAIKDARKLLGKNKLIGGTAHSLSEAIKAESEGADYIGFGHIFPTYSKIKKTKPKGIELLRKVCKVVKVSVIAIGGINISNVKEVMSTGVHGIAVIGGVIKNEYPVKAARGIRKIING